MVPGRVPHRPAARGPGRAGLRRHPAGRARRRRPWPAVRGRLAVPGRRLAAGTDHQCRRLGAGPPVPGAGAVRRPASGGRGAALPARFAGRPGRAGLAGRLGQPGVGALPGPPGPAAGRSRGPASAGGTAPADPVRIGAGRADRPAVRLARGGRADGPPRRRDRRTAHPGERAPPPRRGAVPVRRRAHAAPPGGVRRVPGSGPVGGAGAGGRRQPGGCGAAGAGAGRLGGPEPPSVPARDRQDAVPAGGRSAGQGGGSAGGGPGAVPGHRRGAGRAHGPAPVRGARAAGGRTRAPST